MKIDLISSTPKAEELIMYMARVSSPENQHSNNTKLINYCIKHKHWSPFEMANMVVEINTSRAISAQILRHRSFSFQEFSQRYAKVQEFEIYEARSQDEKNRQNSIDDMDELDKSWFNMTQTTLNHHAKVLYNEAIRRGIAKEQARFLLPIAASTKLYMNGTLRSWMTYFLVRCEAGTQKEHRDIAFGALDIFNMEFPIITEAFLTTYDWLKVDFDKYKSEK